MLIPRMMVIVELIKRFKGAVAIIALFASAWLAVSVLIGMPPIGYVIMVTFIATPTLFYVYKTQHTSLSNARLLLVFLGATLGTLIVIQAIPYGKAHANPPITGEPQWATPRTRELMVRACFGCHSNEVDYPAYASIAPISWVVAAHVSEGRGKVNYQEFDRRQRGMDETVRAVETGWMPPSYYTRFGRHPEAKLTKSELDELISGLKKTPGMTDR